MLKRLHQLAEANEDFAFESTLSSRSFALFIRELKGRGYRVAIHYFSLSSPSLAPRRVKLRVALGGHNVPSDVVTRRFTRSASNFFKLYAPLADEWSVYDNTSAGVAKLVAEFNGTEISIKVSKIWQKLQTLATGH